MRGVTYTGYGRAESRRGDDESAQRLAGVGNCHCPGDGGSRGADGVSRARNPGLPGASWSLVGAESWTMAEMQLLLAISLGEKEPSFSFFIPPQSPQTVPRLARTQLETHWQGSLGHAAHRHQPRTIQEGRCLRREAWDWPRDD